MRVQNDEIKIDADLIVEFIKYPLMRIQYINDEVLKKIATDASWVLFIIIGDENLQFRRVLKSQISRLQNEGQISPETIIANSVIFDQPEYQELKFLSKKSQEFDSSIIHHIVGFRDFRKPSLKSGANFVLRFYSAANMDQFEAQYFEKSNKLTNQISNRLTIDYYGIEQNTRKIIQHIVVQNQFKRQLYRRLIQKLKFNNLNLNLQQNKLMLYALMGNHPLMQSFKRKQKIQAYELQKKRYEEEIRKQNATQISQTIDQIRSRYIIQGYSEKKKMDGVILKRQANKQNKDMLNMYKVNQELFLEKIPDRQEYEVDELLGITNNVQNMHIQQTNIKNQPTRYRAEKLKIPVKDYSLLTKEITEITKEQPTPNQFLDKNLLLGIQTVKFLYQMYPRIGNYKQTYKQKNKSINELTDDSTDYPLDKLLGFVIQILIEIMNRANQKRLVQNKSVSELVSKARRSYLDYRKNPNKFYN